MLRDRLPGDGKPNLARVGVLRAPTLNALPLSAESWKRSLPEGGWVIHGRKDSRGTVLTVD